MMNCTKRKNMFMDSADKNAVLLSNRMIGGSVFRNIWAIVIYWLFIDQPGRCKYNQNHSFTKQRNKLNEQHGILSGAH